MKKISSFLLIAALFLTCGAMRTWAERDNSASQIDYLALVNKLNALPKDWEGALQTVTITNSVGDEVEIEAKAYDAYLALKKDLEENDGIYLELDSARRTVAAQQEIMDRFIEKYGADYAAKP
jgi:D-alanyl-D-alanine carboxypeptidase